MFFCLNMKAADFETSSENILLLESWGSRFQTNIERYSSAWKWTQYISTLCRNLLPRSSEACARLYTYFKILYQLLNYFALNDIW
jgi:hypothetical protein